MGQHTRTNAQHLFLTVTGTLEIRDSSVRGKAISHNEVTSPILHATRCYSHVNPAALQQLVIGDKFGVEHTRISEDTDRLALRPQTYILKNTLHYGCDFCQKNVVKDTKGLPVPCMVPANQAPVPLSVLEPSLKFIYSDQACL
ncbi:hypothetical protein J6590_100069 [Homalodisca vitripennis]|nr:hypothetical protein J6590_100069 [Homalodisca vitripennis]